MHGSIERARTSRPGNIGAELEGAPAVTLFCGTTPEAGLANADYAKSGLKTSLPNSIRLLKTV